MLRSQLKSLEAGAMALGDGGTEENGRQRRTPSRSPSKARSLSDGGQPTLSPSPKFREPEKRKAKDDSSLIASPITPRRPTFERGLSLQIAAKDLMVPNTSAYINRAPLSPKLDHSQIYGSPSSVLPRRSRGLDFSRAATNLHHSTLAEQSSPDSSPTIGGRAMNIPIKRNSLHFLAREESMNASHSLWSTMANADRANVSSSLGSVNMMFGSDTNGSSSEDDDMMDADDIDDSILTTPQVKNDPFGGVPQIGSTWGSNSPAVGSLMNFQRARLRNGKSRKSFSSKGRNSMASLGSRSPPAGMRNPDVVNGFLGRGGAPGEVIHSRRESISWAANQLHISGNESDDGALKSTLESADPTTPGRDGQRPGVIRKVVSRRGNMLPKPKGFARIRAALAEEGAPVETEVRREAEVVRLTRENDVDLEPRHHSMSTQDSTSPTMEATEVADSVLDDDMIMDISQGLSSSFKEHAKLNSKGADFWDKFKDDSSRKSTPPTILPRGSSSGISEDIGMDSPSICTPPLFPSRSASDPRSSSPSRSATPQPTHAEMTRKVNNKRRRDDDFDPTSFKRRAVSPGMSVHNSPVLQSSPWGGSRPSSNGESGKPGPNGSMKQRVGFPSFVSTTNDELMKMSIE